MTGTDEAEANVIMFGGQMSSILLPAYATAVFYDKVNFGGDAGHIVFNDQGADQCIDLCDLPVTPHSAYVSFSTEF